MKRGFVRGLWGTYDKNKRFCRHRDKINKDIELTLYNKYLPDYITYVFGEDNYKQLLDLGINCKLVDKRSAVWDMDKKQFRHKLEILKLAAEELDEFVFTDIDTLPIKPIPDDFWDVLNKKESIQAVLRMYHRRKCYWRIKNKRVTPCAAFIYIRDKNISNNLIKTWEEMKEPMFEEIVLMKYIDEMTNGWRGTEYYWDHFEPEFFNLVQNSAFSDKQKLESKNICFRHFNLRSVGSLLRCLKSGKKTTWDCFK